MSRRAEEKPDCSARLEASEEDVCGEDRVGEGLVFGVGGMGEEVRHCVYWEASVNGDGGFDVRDSKLARRSWN